MNVCVRNVGVVVVAGALVVFIALAGAGCASGGRAGEGFTPRSERERTVRNGLRQFETLIGTWKGEGYTRPSADGEKTPRRAVWEIDWALDGLWVRMEFLNRFAEEPDRAGSPWAGFMTYDPEGATLRTVWAHAGNGFTFRETGGWDETGRVLVLHSVWDLPEGKTQKHRSTFRVIDCDHVRVVDEDFDEEKGEWWESFVYELERRRQ